MRASGFHRGGYHVIWFEDFGPGVLRHSFVVN